MPDSRYRSSRRSRSRSVSPRGGAGGDTGKRLHVADLDQSVTRRDIEDAYGRFGRLADVWVASYPPFYGFVVYERSDDAQSALREMKRGYVGKCAVRTTIALPRGSKRPRSPPRRGFRSDRFDDSGRERGGRYERGGDRYERDDRRGDDRDDRRSRRDRSRSPRPSSYRRSPDSRKRDRSPIPDTVSD